MKGAFLLLVACLGNQEEFAEARRAMASGDYHAAWERIESESDELVRLRGRAELLYRAGDPAGSLRAAKAGLEMAPSQIDLIYHAAGAAIWMEDGQQGTEYSTRLLRAAEELDKPGETSWREAGRRLAERAEAVTKRQAGIDRSVTRLRLVSAGGFALWLCAVGAALWLQGRSSRPVS